MKPTTWVTATLLVILATTQAPAKTWTEITDDYIRGMIIMEAKRQNMDPAICLAVAHVESRLGHREFRTGLIGKRYFGPMALHKDFLTKWPEKRIDTLEGNIRCGIQALHGRSLKSALKRYNATYTTQYYHAILSEAKRYRQEGQGGAE